MQTYSLTYLFAKLAYRLSYLLRFTVIGKHPKQAAFVRSGKIKVFKQVKTDIRHRTAIVRLKRACAVFCYRAYP